MRDLTKKPCYIVKQNNVFAHGDTLKEAYSALEDKLFDGLSADARIEAFVVAHKTDTEYPNTDFFDWHHKLTGSCLMGRKTFAANHGIDMDGSMTVKAFINLTDHDYGRDIIQQLIPFYTEALDGQ